MLNVVAIMGRLVADPELKITPAASAYAPSASPVTAILCSRASSGRPISSTSLHGGTMQTSVQILCQGQHGAVQGRLQTWQYQDRNGSNRTAWRSWRTA